MRATLLLPRIIIISIVIKVVMGIFIRVDIVMALLLLISAGF